MAEGKIMGLDARIKKYGLPAVLLMSEIEKMGKQLASKKRSLAAYLILHERSKRPDSEPATYENEFHG